MALLYYSDLIGKGRLRMFISTVCGLACLQLVACEPTVYDDVEGKIVFFGHELRVYKPISGEVSLFSSEEQKDGQVCVSEPLAYISEDELIGRGELHDSPVKMALAPIYVFSGLSSMPPSQPTQLLPDPPFQVWHFQLLAEEDQMIVTGRVGKSRGIFKLDKEKNIVSHLESSYLFPLENHTIYSAFQLKSGAILLEDELDVYVTSWGAQDVRLLSAGRILAVSRSGLLALISMGEADDKTTVVEYDSVRDSLSVLFTTEDRVLEACYSPSEKWIALTKRWDFVGNVTYLYIYERSNNAISNTWVSDKNSFYWLP